MTAARTPFDLGASYGVSSKAERRLAAAPAEGWTSVLLLVFMCALVGWAIDDVRSTNHGKEWSLKGLLTEGLKQ